jgi:hypothetical protein
MMVTMAARLAATRRLGIATTATAAENHPVQQLEGRSALRIGHTQQTDRHQGGQQNTTLHGEGSLIRKTASMWNITASKPLAPSVFCLWSVALGGRSVTVQQLYCVLIS